MLLRFSVNNFMSFCAEEEFSMLAGRVQKFDERIVDDGTLRFLKFCALYGANASGKSNMIKAIDFARRVITRGIAKLNYEDLHFKLEQGKEDEASKFEFEIKILDNYLAYGFNLDLKRRRIVGEWLYELTQQEEKMLFEREYGQVTIGETLLTQLSPQNQAKIEVYSEDIMNMDNVLFLSEIARKRLDSEDFKIFNRLYYWFSEHLEIVYPDKPVGSSIPRLFTGHKEDDIIDILEYFDTGITSYEIEESSLEQLKKAMPAADVDEILTESKNTYGKLKESSETTFEIGIITDTNLFKIVWDNYELKIYELLFKHANNDKVTFTFGEESDGTKRLIQLLGVICAANDKKVFIIDEIDRSLHPHLTKKFIETFLKGSERESSQLIVTTHESNLLDLEMLRRDEIWFVEKNDDLSSRLYSLDEFRVRYDKRIEKDYLIGRYGAIPAIKDYETFLGAQKCQE